MQENKYSFLEISGTEKAKDLEHCTELYKNIAVYHDKGVYSHIKLQLQHLKTTLRPYQEDAVRWMLHREKELKCECNYYIY